MSYPFVAAAAQFGVRKGPVKAFVAHMAEGGGTVGFLSRPNPRNVSVHYVIEYGGRIVQMVKESDASGSINPNDLRTTDDPETFGATVRKAVMGEWDRDPNSAVISLEIEGFAAAGPNTAQQAALVALVNDVRSRYPDMGLLGHRDYQDYKACPGKLIPWAALGGHGTGDDMSDTTITILPFGGTFVIPAGTKVSGFTLVAGKVVAGPSVGPSPTPSTARYDATMTTTATRGNPFIRVIDGPLKGCYVAASAVTETPTPPAPIDCTAQVAAEHERTRAAAIAAVGAIK